MEKRKWDMLKEDMLRRLRDLDEEAALLLPDSQRLRLVIVGGGALILMEVIARSTHDIDALAVSPQLRSLLADYDINCDVQAYSCNFAYNYESRLQKLPIDGQVIDFYTASLEDIVIAKLFSIRPQDREDIISPAVLAQLDWERLHQIAHAPDEVMANVLSDRSYRDFLYDFSEYERRYRPCGN